MDLFQFSFIIWWKKSRFFVQLCHQMYQPCGSKRTWTFIYWTIWTAKWPATRFTRCFL